MNTRILFYLGLCLLWLIMAIAISLGFHERLLEKADEWKKYLAIGICVLMMGFNLLRIYLIRTRAAMARQSNDHVQ